MRRAIRVLVFLLLLPAAAFCEWRIEEKPADPSGLPVVEFSLAGNAGYEFASTTKTPRLLIRSVGERIDVYLSIPDRFAVFEGRESTYSDWDTIPVEGADIPTGVVFVNQTQVSIHVDDEKAQRRVLRVMENGSDAVFDRSRELVRRLLLARTLRAEFELADGSKRSDTFSLDGLLAAMRTAGGKIGWKFECDHECDRSAQSCRNADGLSSDVRNPFCDEARADCLAACASGGTSRWDFANTLLVTCTAEGFAVGILVSDTYERAYPAVAEALESSGFKVRTGTREKRKIIASLPRNASAEASAMFDPGLFGKITVEFFNDENFVEVRLVLKPRDYVNALGFVEARREALTRGVLALREQIENRLASTTP